MRTSLLLGTAAALALSGCAGDAGAARDLGRAPTVGPVAAGSDAFDILYGRVPSADEASDGEFAAVGVTMTPAPSTATPATTSRQALDAVRADGTGNSLPRPTVTLKSFTKAGPMFATGKPMIDALVWDVVFADAPVRVHTPSDYSGPYVEPVPCDLHVIVDAESGEALESFQAGCTGRT